MLATTRIFSFINKKQSWWFVLLAETRGWKNPRWEGGYKNKKLGRENFSAAPRP